MDKKQELMKFCRLYKGEAYNPYNTDQNKAAIWDYEWAWLFESLKPSSTLLIANLEDYTSSGLALFNIHDGVSATLKATLFNRYARTHYTLIDAIAPFKDFYKAYLSM
ncbi:MAG: hypothetical protein Q4A56_09125 [Porphyromonadaceae bacterium]|nr:hypothetical protein [Porphyromonadaceae bacterium]